MQEGFKTTVRVGLSSRNFREQLGPLLCTLPSPLPVPLMARGIPSPGWPLTQTGIQRLVDVVKMLSPG